jgi:quercetin dioxygenase-like cupin family protein
MTNSIVHKKVTSSVSGEEADQFKWGSIQWLVSGGQNTDGTLTFGYVQIEPGQKNPRHYHPQKGTLRDETV